ncbi:MAG: biopolymer transporter ExbD [Spongiibacteraceae bacterium]|nr:biopolymer transporter ExbD [Spongiibacteraceae bacterium]
MQFKRQINNEVSVNLTPLIDVVFLLLIFFMVSTTFTNETHLSLDLPEANGEPNPERTNAVEIVIDRNGQYTVNGRSIVNTQLNTLITALKDVSQGDSTLALVITADAKTPHQAVVTAMEAAGQSGFATLSLTTKTPTGD